MKEGAINLNTLDNPGWISAYCRHLALRRLTLTPAVITTNYGIFIWTIFLIYNIMPTALFE